MPQLAFETFVSQYVWLVITFFSLYYIMVNKLIPLINEGLKARENIEESAKTLKSQASTQLATISSHLIKDITSDSLKLTKSGGITRAVNYIKKYNKNFKAWAKTKKVKRSK
jgi:hypothetical protein